MAEGTEIARGSDRRQKNAITKAAPEGSSGTEKRRMYPLFFKLQVLKSFREDPDCKSNQRATARKYGIHRRQVQKWLHAEQSLRKSMGTSQADAYPPQEELCKTGAVPTPSPILDLEMKDSEAIGGSPLSRDESASSDGIVGSSSSSSYSEDGSEPLNDVYHSVQFMVTVLNAYHDSPDWHGKEAATAQKFGIKRWQLRRWLKREADIRAEVAACNRCCGELLRPSDCARCEFTPEAMLAYRESYSLSLCCVAPAFDRPLPDSSPNFPAQQVCDGERCPYIAAQARICTPSPPTQQRSEERHERFPKPLLPPKIVDGCLDFSTGKRQQERESTSVAEHAKLSRRNKEDAGECTQAVEMQVRVLDLRKSAEGPRGCCDAEAGGAHLVRQPYFGQCKTTPPPAPPCDAEDWPVAVPRWPNPLPPPAHTPWPLAVVGEQRLVFSTAPPPAHCGQLYW